MKKVLEVLRNAFESPGDLRNIVNVLMDNSPLNGRCHVIVMDNFPKDTRWELCQEIGSGTFSRVFEGTFSVVKEKFRDTRYALKCAKSEIGKACLKREAEVLALLTLCPCKFYSDVPKFIEIREDADPAYLLMELKGRTINDLRKQFSFSHKTIAMVGVQLISAFEALHEAGIIHKDVKPDNLAVSLNADDPKMYILDFGAGGKYVINGTHVCYQEWTSYTGNSIFASSTVTRGIRSSRRDDMESIGYVLLYLFDKALPWSQINSLDYFVRAQHLRMKEEVQTTTLSTVPEPEYLEYIQYCRNLRFEEKPNYDYLRGLLMRVAIRLGFDGSWDYEWVPKPAQKVALRKVPSPIVPPKRRSSRKRSRIERMMWDLGSTSLSPGEMLDSLKHPGNTVSRYLCGSSQWPYSAAIATPTKLLYNSVNCAVCRKDQEERNQSSGVEDSYLQACASSVTPKKTCIATADMRALRRKSGFVSQTQDFDLWLSTTACKYQ